MSKVESPAERAGLPQLTVWQRLIDLELSILLLLAPGCWDCRHAPDLVGAGDLTRALCMLNKRSTKLGYISSPAYCSSGWFRTHYVQQASLKLSGLILVLPPECWYYTCVPHTSLASYLWSSLAL